MGRLAHLASTGRLDAVLAKAQARAKGIGLTPSTGGVPPDDGDENNPAGGQAEMTVAVDITGQHVVIGFNDTRGFSLNPVSISGFAYSDDGGATFTDGGQLPVVSNGSIGTTQLPQVFGDPDVKYVPGGAGCQFIYSSILVKGFSGTPPTFTGAAQSLAVHRSTDCGHTWTGPFEVTAATNPHGLLSGTNAFDAADKEFIDVDPETGRVIVAWTNFTSTTFIPSGTEIRTTFSDDIMSATPPTWSAGVVLNPGATLSESGAIPRFAGNGSTNVYVAWNRRDSLTATTYGGWPYNNERFSRSTNNGATWSAPISLQGSDFYPIDYILGNDRVHSFPGMAVDNSSGPNSGNIYVAYASNTALDGSDIVFHRSTDGGVTFSPGIALNGRPGADRAQWFPYVAADRDTGRVSVMYYDQGISSSGDVTETTWIYSDDGGVSWSKPSPLTNRPFHGGYGNDTGQPNLGDYIGCDARSGALSATWAGTPPVVLFTDGQPTSSFTVPDFYFARKASGAVAVALGTPTFTDSGANGFIDAGETVQLQIPIRNMVTNVTTGTATYTGVSGTLSAITPGVSIVQGTRPYPDVAPGATQTNTGTFVVQLAPTYLLGAKLELALAVSTVQGSTTLLFTLNTGTPSATTIFSEDFNGVAPGTLPAGWATIHAGGNNTVPWTTNNTFGGTASNGLFHVNANDGLSGDHTRFERVASPSIVVPAGSEYVTLDFDIAYDLEDDPGFNVLAYDGATFRITDFTAGRFARANLVESFAEGFTTGSFFHFPKHLPRSGSSAYFQDMSVWSGDSAGFKHVSMRFNGMQGSTIQLRPDFTQDGFGTCTDVRPTHTVCGVLIDNIVLKSVVSILADLAITNTPSSSSIHGGTDVAYTLVLTNNGPTQADAVTMTYNLPAPLSFVSCNATNGGVCGGSGNNRAVAYTSLANGASSIITIVASVPCSVADGTVISATATVSSATTPDNIFSNNSATASFTVTGALPAPVITAPSTVGAGSPGHTASVPSNPGSTYTWMITNGAITSGQGTNQVTFTAGVVGTLTLEVTETNGAGCMSAPGAANVSVIASGASLFYTLTPCRLVDTRNANGPLGGPALAASGSPDRSFTLAGACGIPAGAVAVSVNMTVVNPAAGGFLSIYRGDGSLTGTTSISFDAVKTRANNAILELATDGSGAVKVNNSSAGTVNFILDVNGYFQ